MNGLQSCVFSTFDQEGGKCSKLVCSDGYATKNIARVDVTPVFHTPPPSFCWFQRLRIWGLPSSKYRLTLHPKFTLFLPMFHFFILNLCTCNFRWLDVEFLPESVLHHWLVSLSETC